MPTNQQSPCECLVVMYHYVHDEPPTAPSEQIGPHQGIHALSIAAFADQLDQLCAAMEPIDWPTLYAWSRGDAELPSRSFLLTFDDGLSDHARNVAPVLEQRGLRGTFFVPGTVLKAPRMLPAHAIHVLLSRLGDERFERALRETILEEPDGEGWRAMLDGGGASTEPQSANAYHYETSARARLKTWLTFQLPIALRNRIIDALFQSHVGASERWARHWYLSWDDLTALQSRRHTIGGHGYSHEPPARMDARTQKEDMIRCADTLTKGLGAAARPFSYPYGSHNADTHEACRRAGFAQAFTTESRRLHYGEDPMRLPRIDTIHVSANLQAEEACARAQ